MTKLTWPRAFVLVAFIAASVAVFLWARDLGRAREAAEAKRATSRPPMFQLPPQGAGAAGLLGSSRLAVRARLGTPSETVANTERFDVGVPLRFFYEDDRATALIVQVEGASRHEPALRRWLGIGLGRTVTVGGRRLRADWLTEDGPDSFSVTLEPEIQLVQDATDDAPREVRSTGRPRAEKTESARRPRGSGGLVRLAGELVRGFPEVPDALRSRCEASVRNGVTELACRDGVDALVDYQLANDGSWSTLTILGPGGTDEKQACRQWLERHVPDAVPVGQRQQDDELQVYFTRGPLRYLVSFLTLPRPGAGASCSLMACQEDGRGHGTACRPR